MAKDAKGHGSETRGGSYQNIDKNLSGPGKHVGYGGGDVYRIRNTGSYFQGIGQKTGDYISGPTLGNISAQLAAKSVAAATALSGDHPKSTAVPVHDSMQRARDSLKAARGNPLPAFGLRAGARERLT